jgi:hypothetical protein
VRIGDSIGHRRKAQLLAAAQFWHETLKALLLPASANVGDQDLAALLKVLRDDGKFGWAMDPEGNKVELWQPPQGQ